MKTVIIVGLYAPFDDDPGDAEVWGCNRSYIHQCEDPNEWADGKPARFPKKEGRPSLDRLFFFDNLNILEEHGHKDFIEHVNKLDIPVITKKHDPRIPKSEAYPLGDILKSVRLLPKDSDGSLQDILNRGHPYFTSTISYMIAQAIYEGFDHIIVHRMQVAPHSCEYYEQKACINFWMGICIGRGIQFSTSNDSYLGKPHPWEPPLYGYVIQKSADLASHMLGDVTKNIMRLETSFHWSKDLGPEYGGTIPKVKDRCAA